MEVFVLVIISLTVTSCLSSHHYVRYDGKTEVWEGEPFEISCVISYDDKPGWTINSSLITEDNPFGYTLTERTLDPYYQELTIEVKSAQLHHEGDYRCNQYKRDFHHVEILPSFAEVDQYEKEEAPEQKPENEYVLEYGKTYQFDCFSAKEKDTPITWYKNGKRIAEYSESNIILSGLSLVIENAQDDDAGLYMCTVETPFVTGFNDIGRIFYLNSPAKIIDFPEKKSITRNGTLHIECNAQGFPQPQITWYIGNVNASVLKETDYRITIYPLSGGQPMSHLKIYNVTESDAGLYTCQASNSIDSGRSTHSVEESVFVYVKENMIETNEDEPGMGKLLIPEEPLVLQCNTSECGHCTLVWFKDGEQLHPIENHLEIHEKNKSIIIVHATYDDSGVYMCALNRTVLDVALNATIVVQSKIKLDKFDASSVVVEGSPLELYCNAKASPPPFIKWFIGDQEIYEGDERVKLLEYDGLKKGKLVIEEADYQDRNHYTCEAFNQVDSINTTVFIRIKDKLAALWPFLGICAEVVILCSIIFVYERRKSMNQSDEPETDLPTENKHHRDQKGKGQDVRQRK